MSSILNIKNGSFGYPGTTVVKEVYFTLSRGEFVTLEGENGSGKSTLIRTILGTLPLLSGNISWSITQQDIGYIPQDMSLDRSAPATAFEVVLTAFPFGRGKKVEKKAMDALELVGLAGCALHRYGTLSGGQRRRVLFARALATNPLCLILDEPTVNMDSETEKELGLLLHDLVTRENRTVLTTSHVTEWITHSRTCRIVSGRFYG